MDKHQDHFATFLAFQFPLFLRLEAILMEILIRPLWEKNDSVFEYWDTITASIMAIILNSKFLTRNTVHNFSSV